MKTQTKWILGIFGGLVVIVLLFLAFKKPATSNTQTGTASYTGGKNSLIPGPNFAAGLTAFNELFNSIFKKNNSNPSTGYAPGATDVPGNPAWQAGAAA